MKKNNRKLGAEAEDIVSRLYEKRSFKILHRNYYSRFGELDIVAGRKGLIVIIEVKYRENDCFSAPSEAVNQSKRKKIIKTAEIYLHENGFGGLSVRFDVAEVVGVEKRINIIEDAFSFESADWQEGYI